MAFRLVTETVWYGKRIAYKLGISKVLRKKSVIKMGVLIMSETIQPIKDEQISVAIIEKYLKKLVDYSNVDVAIAGSGPAGLVAAYYLAKAGFKTAIFEKKLSVGGGMWGGRHDVQRDRCGPGR